MDHNAKYIEENVKNVTYYHNKNVSEYLRVYDAITKWDIAHLRSAEKYAELSHAVRKKVGAVAVTPQDVSIFSYNGTASGDDNCCEDNWGKDLSGNDVLVSKNTVLHSERNILAKSAKEGISLKDSTVYVTMSPCLECSLMLYQAGVSRVIFIEKYRDVSGIEYLVNHGVTVIQLELN